MYNPGEIFVHYLSLYKYNIKNESLLKVCSVEGFDTIPYISYTRWLKEGTILYFMIFCIRGGQKEYEIFKYIIGDSNCHKINDNEKEIILNKFKNKKNKNNILKKSKILYYVDCIPLSQWNVPSPLEYCSLSKKQLIQTFIEGIGDSSFQNEAFKKLESECSSKELKAVAIGIQNKYNELYSYEKMKYASYRDRWFTKFMLASKYGPQSKGDDIALGKAIYNHHNDAAKRIIDKSNLNCSTKDNNGTTLLMIAAYADNVEVVSLLLSKKCNINERDNYGCTPLMYAIFGNAVHTMDLLLKNNANVMVESNSHYIAWMYINNAGMRQHYLSLVDMEKHKSVK